MFIPKDAPPSIKTILLSKFANGFLFFLPILALYYQNILFDVSKVALIFSIGALAMVLFEVPSGAVADLFGRKNTILLGNLISILSVIILFFAQSFWVLIMYAIFRAASRSLRSGTDEAFIYDTLYGQGKTHLYKKYVGLLFSVWAVGAALGSLLGGHLADISLRLPIILTTIPLLVAFILTLFLEEPHYHKERHKNIFKHMITSSTRLLQNKQLLLIFIGTCVLFAFSEGMHEMNSLFFAAKNIPVAFFGYASAAVFGFSSLGHYVSHDISKKLGNKKTLLFTIFGSGAIIALATQINSIWALFVYSLSSLFFGIRNPVKSHFINHETPSSQRATIISLSNLINRLGFALIVPILGVLAKVINVETAFLIGSTIMVATIGIFYFVKDIS